MGSNFIIYMHKNKINNKIYIGQTCQSPEKRWGQNGIGYKRQIYFYNAIQKYGWDNFEHIILKKNLTLEQANYWESYYIALYHSNNRLYGYNSFFGGNNSIPNAETRKKMSQAHLGYKPTEEQKKKLSISNIGKHNFKHTEEAKLKMSKNRPSKRVECININKVFNSIKEASEWCGLKSMCNISEACRGIRKTAGKHPITKEALKWRFIENDSK